MIKALAYSHFSRRIFEKISRLPYLGNYISSLGNFLAKDYLLHTKSELQKMSPSFCTAKWLQSTLHLEIGQTHSCHHPTKHSLDYSELQSNPRSMHNTAIKINARKEMLSGKFPKECDYCWQIESSNNISDRFYKSSEDWAITNLKELAKDENIYNINPSYLEVSFSSQCNLKCAYCDPMVSSSIRKEIETMGPYPTSKQFQNLGNYINSMRDLKLSAEDLSGYFWKWWPDLKGDLKVLRITGGEPLLSSDLFRLLEHFEDNEDALDLDFAINSNLMVSRNIIEKFILKIDKITRENKIKKFTLFTSIDTWGKHAEFLRWGLKIESFKENIETLLTSLPNLNLTFLVTYQALSPFKFNELLEFILDLRRRYPKSKIKIGISYLRDPQFLSLSILNKLDHSLVLNNLQFMKKRMLRSRYPEGFSVFEIQHLERIYQNLSNQTLDNQLDQKDFKIFIHEYEKRKNIKFEDYFGEAKNLISLLR